MQFRLRTLLIVLALASMVLAGCSKGSSDPDSGEPNLIPLGAEAALLSAQNQTQFAPRLLQEKTFNAASFADAVNYFVDLGEEAATLKLRSLERDPREGIPYQPEGAVDVNERIGWLCRVLFESKDNNPLRAPRFGGLLLPYLSMPNESWPLYPVAQSGSTFFVLDEGYELAGTPEDTGDYISYCRQTGVFRKKRIPVPTKAQAQTDATALRQSLAWKAIKWTDSGQGWSYGYDEPWAWKFIQRQADKMQ